MKMTAITNPNSSPCPKCGGDIIAVPLGVCCNRNDCDWLETAANPTMLHNLYGLKGSKGAEDAARNALEKGICPDCGSEHFRLAGEGKVKCIKCESLYDVP